MTNGDSNKSPNRGGVGDSDGTYYIKTPADKDTPYFEERLARHLNIGLADLRQRIVDNVEVALYDAKIVPTYEDALSPRKRRQGMVDEPDIGHNLVPDDGLLLIGSLWLNVSPPVNPASHNGVSTSSSSITAATHDLAATKEKIAITSKFQVTNVSHADTFWDTSQGNVGTINSTGLFNSSSDYVSTPVMFCGRVLSSGKLKDNTKTMTVAWAVTLTAL